MIFGDADERVVTGTRSLVEERRMVLQSLMPALTGTNETLEFYVTSLPGSKKPLRLKVRNIAGDESVIVL